MIETNSNDDEKNISLSNTLILGRLGRGSTSHVFKIQFTKNKKIYAMKVIDKKDKNYNLKDLHKEISLHQKLTNLHVVRLIKHLEDVDNHYVITEYCSRGEMSQLIKNQLSESQLASAAYQIALALKYLHEHAQIAHCDLKLSNILVEGNLLKLCDFGYSSEIKSNKAKNEQSCAEPLFGTLLYMAPEVLLTKRRQHLKQADIWAFGICLLTLMLKKQPYEGQNYHQVKKKILNGEHQKIPSLSPEFQNLLDRLLEPNYQKRIKISEILKHSFFQKYHIEEQYEQIINNQISKNVFISEEFTNTSKFYIQKQKKNFDEIKREPSKNNEIKKSMEFVKLLESENQFQAYNSKKTEISQADFFRTTSHKANRNEETLIRQMLKRSQISSYSDNNQTIKTIKNTQFIEKTPKQNQSKSSQSDFERSSANNLMKSMRMTLERIQKQYQDLNRMGCELNEKKVCDKNTKESRQIKPIIAKLLHPLEAFKYETKNNTTIEIKCNGDVSISIKGIIYDIVDEGRYINFTNQSFQIENLKGHQKIIQIYQYAFDIVEIIKNKKYCHHSQESFNQNHYTFALQKYKRFFICFLSILHQKTYLIFYHKINGSRVKIFFEDSKEIYIPVEEIIANQLNLQRNLVQKYHQSLRYFLEKEKRILEEYSD